jgi:hypothetical protein
MKRVDWLLLVHHIPPDPPYLRAKVLRRLTQSGAVPLKRSAYLLPESDAALEDFEWLRRLIDEQGGNAWIVQGALIGGLSDAQARELFRAARRKDYDEVLVDARPLLESVRRGRTTPSEGSPEPEWRRLQRRVQAIEAIDFFHAEGAKEVRTVMTEIERTLHPTGKAASATPVSQLRARTWVTRTGIKVDRMASAWLIRRFIDPAATFAFVAPDGQVPEGAIRFDMFEGEFTHQADRCTFEVLLHAAGRAEDKALAAIGEAIHDLDLHDERYQRPEAAGLRLVLDGIVARHRDDVQRLAESGPLFDALYEGLRR